MLFSDSNSSISGFVWTLQLSMRRIADSPSKLGFWRRKLTYGIRTINKYSLKSGIVMYAGVSVSLGLMHLQQKKHKLKGCDDECFD
jgi:hypothetical protein